jgi:hypothetical protein
MPGQAHAANSARVLAGHDLVEALNHRCPDLIRVLLGPDRSFRPNHACRAKGGTVVAVGAPDTRFD